MRRATRTVLPLLRPSTSLLLPSRPLHTLRKPLPPRRPVSSPFRRYSTPDTSPSSSTPTSTKACPACGSPLDLREISCAECGALSPLPENINYLTLFNISAEKPFKFDIDVGQLRREYLKLMSKVHPDSVISGSDVSLLCLFPICPHRFYFFLILRTTSFPPCVFFPPLLMSSGTKENSRKCFLNDNPRLLHPPEPPVPRSLPPTPLSASCSRHRKHQARGSRVINDGPGSPGTNRRGTNT